MPDWPGVWALGDCALVPDPLNPGKFYPPTAQHAIRQAATLAGNIVSSMRGQASQPFKFKIIGLLATIGRRAAVVSIGKVHLTGFLGWLFWGLVHIYFLIGLRRRFVVAINWLWDYLTFQRGARLITEVPRERR